MKERPVDEKALLKLISEGDESAFRTIYDTYYDHIFGVAFAFMKSTAMAEDAVQEVFCKIWYKRTSLPLVEKFDAYLFMVARNHILTEIRNNLRQKEYVESLRKYLHESDETPLQTFINNESEEIIRKAVEALPAQQKSVYKLTREDGLSQAEIAGKLSISKNTVRNHMNASLRFIRLYILARNSIPVMILIRLGLM
jgi:RNA polymerase sigma-70 factor (family 1)